MKFLEQPIHSLKGVGVKRAQLYEKLGVLSVYSLLTYYPRDYIDFTHPKQISDAIIGESCAIFARVYKKQPEQRIRKGLVLYKVFVTDGISDMVITIYNNKYAYMGLELDHDYLFYGKISGNFVRKEMNSPLVLPPEGQLTMQPIYPLTEGLTSKMIITNQKEALSYATKEAWEPLPKWILEQYHLCGWNYAMQQIHFPKNKFECAIARKRLVFEELLVWQIGMMLLRQNGLEQTAVQIKDTDLSPFLQQLPFTLTDAQLRVIQQCVEDFQKETPMNRLVQGDVGCGKTMVAAACCYLMAKNGFQSAMMAPTEILATQHYETLSNLLEPLGIHVCLLTGSMTKKQKDTVKSGIELGIYQLVVGTHALVQDSTVFQKLGLVITDEQHRFGVGQRQKLASKGDHPHVMVMSATPIPRTLALILYGDLDLSVIDQLPKGRQTIDTFAIPPSKRERAYGFIYNLLEQGRQAYIVCPMIEDSDRDAANVVAYGEHLKKTCLKDHTIGILHGKLAAQEKDDIMNQFKRGELQLLISTTVVEVGVDVPNAVVMMIENAELFGLSQMHQLRGRVGRGTEKSYCILVSGLNTPENRQRLDTMCKTTNGFQIAEQDLKQRGPGDFFGKRQHGMVNFKLANMVEDMKTLETTQALAQQLVRDDPGFYSPEHQGLKWLIERLFQEKETAL